MDITVIIPAYNAEKTIGRCLGSIIRSSCDGITYEVIVVNDGSGDDTEKAVKRFCEKYDNIRYFRKENGGVSSARNMGIREARGEYITFVDCDDYVRGDYFKRLGLSMGHDIAVFPYILKQRVYGKNRVSVVKCTDDESIADMYSNNLVNSPCNKLYRRSICGEFPEGTAIGEDLMFNIPLFTEHKDVIYCGQPVYVYDMADGSATNRYKRQYVKDYAVLYPAAVKFCRENSIDENIAVRRFTGSVNYLIYLLANSSGYEYGREVRYMWKKLSMRNEFSTKNIRFVLFRERCFTLLGVFYKLLHIVKER